MVPHAKRALLERAPEAEEFFGVLAQLCLHECAEIGLRVFRYCPGRHPQDSDLQRDGWHELPT
jgi:hypothetical protein